MAYLVFCTADGKELGTRRLDKSITVGRAPDCDVSVHDIQLSRHHCRLERTGEGWVVTDLQSKNGTVIDGRPVTRHPLRPGEVIHIGRIRVTFRAGKPSPEAKTTDQLAKPRRPADPFNASEGTVAGFVYEPPAGERSVEKFPTPKPVLTESGRWVAQGIEAGQAEAAPGGRAAVDGPRHSCMDSTIAARAIPRSARPKAPAPAPALGTGGADGSGILPAVAPAPAPLTVPAPPRAPLGLRVRMFLRSIGRGLRKPLGRWAALLV